MVCDRALGLKATASVAVPRQLRPDLVETPPKSGVKKQSGAKTQNWKFLRFLTLYNSSTSASRLWWWKAAASCPA